MFTVAEHERIRQARGKFAAMACTFFLGVFNDNFFKQAALVLAVAAGDNDMQGYCLAIFTFPFLLFAAPAGWAADRFPKRSVVISAKWVELIAMLFGAGGICLGQWELIFTMLAIMGLQATFFSPALNGSLPELYPESYIPQANGVLRMLVTAAILTGVALAGIALDRAGIAFWQIEKGRLLVGAIVIGVALFGLLVSYGVPARPAADQSAPFPWSGPLYTLKQLYATRQDPVLAITIFMNVFVWFVGSLEILIINPLGIQQFHLTKTVTSYLIVAELVGIAAGGLLIGKLIAGRRWSRVLGPTGIVMGVLMLALAAVPSLPPAAQVPSLFVLIALIGMAGGFILIPVESFLQVRPAADRKGAVLAAANFAVFSGIMLSSFISNELNNHFQPTTSFAVLGGVAIPISLILLIAYRRFEERS